VVQGVRRGLAWASVQWIFTDNARIKLRAATRTEAVVKAAMMRVADVKPEDITVEEPTKASTNLLHALLTNCCHADVMFAAATNGRRQGSPKYL
jgi:hypothetical protein